MSEKCPPLTDSELDLAFSEGATDVEIHDTVLIAAAFCMFNRYVDGLATFAPQDQAVYAENARFIAEKGYVATLERGNPGPGEGQ